LEITEAAENIGTVVLGARAASNRAAANTKLIAES
jgi:hypothetical protein